MAQIIVISVSSKMNNDYSKGVLYIALGEAYALMALLSIKGLRSFSNVGITIALNSRALKLASQFPKDVNIVQVGDDDSRFIKTRMYELSPYSQTLYIDCDTIIQESIDCIFLLLDHFDIALKQRRIAFAGRGKGALQIFDGAQKVSDLPHWNSGVVLFKKNNLTQALFNEWHLLQVKLGYKLDQPALAEALLKSSVRIVCLEDKWNLQDVSQVYSKSGVILHYSSSINREIRRQLCSMAKDISYEYLEIMNIFIKRKLAIRIEKDGKWGFLKRRIKWFYFDIKNLF